MYNRGSALMATALLLILVNHSQTSSAAAEAPLPGPTAASTANKTTSKVLSEVGVGLGMKADAASIPKVDKGSVKKDEPRVPEAKEVIITEKPKEEKVVVAPSPKAAPLPPASPNLPLDGVHIEQPTYNDEVDIPGQAFFYVLVGITSTAIVLLVVRVYGLRLSRAERKYGVQGDRANQELTPLPMAIEDVNSDEEDHTVFELGQV